MYKILTFDRLIKFTIDIYKPIWKEHNGNQKSDSVVDPTIHNLTIKRFVFHFELTDTTIPLCYGNLYQ